MPTSYPASLDSFPSAATLTTHQLSTDPHSTLHGNLGAALLAVETQVGITGAFNFLLCANNLSDLTSASAARSNLGLGSAATHPASDFDSAGAAAAAIVTAEAYTDSAIAALSTVYQPLDADLTALAALSSTAGMLSRTGAGAFAVRTLTGPAAGITVSNGTGAAGDPTLALANDLSAVEGLSGTGLATRTATDTWTVRTVTGTTDVISVTNGDGVSGNPTLTIAATYAGQTSITTLGTIATGTWAGTTITVDHGGSGRASATAYAPICGGTTTTAAHQSTTLTANAYPLVSAGTSAVPTFTGTYKGNTISSDAGTALSLSATAPTQTASAQAGVAASLVASDAVAGSSNAGAAAGADATVAAGAAARLTSGNANGGGVVLKPAAGIGTGTAGNVVVRQPGGTPGTDELQISHDGTTCRYKNPDSTGGIVAHSFDLPAGSQLFQILDTQFSRACTIIPNGNSWINIGGWSGVSFQCSGNVQIGNGNQLVFAQSGSGFTSRVGLVVDSTATVVKVTDASSGKGWLQNSAGRARVTADVTESAGTLTSISDLSITLIAGRKYFGRLVLFVNESVAADGIQFDFNGGAATMTDFRTAAGVLTAGGAVVAGTNTSTALNTALTFTTWTGEGCVTIEFGLICNAAGTFIPRFSQVAHTSGTATVRKGSNLLIEDSPN